MRLFKTKYFHRWAKHEKLADESLLKSFQELSAGLHDGHLAVGLYKKRVCRDGKGKRSSMRTIIAYKQGKHAFFIYGYAKNVKENITAKELDAYKELARIYLGLEERTLNRILLESELFEVNDEEKNL